MSEKTLKETIETIAVEAVAKFTEKIAEKLYDYEHEADETDVDDNLTAGDLALIIEEAAREIRQENTGL